MDNTRHNRNGKDLNREFWRDSRQPEIRLLESELWSHAFHGLISLHTDDTSDGLYGYAHGAVLTEHLLRPALAAASAIPAAQPSAMSSTAFAPATASFATVTRACLRAPPGVRPRPFEIILETPHHAPQYLQEAALAVAVCAILDEYRKFIAYAQNL